MLRWGRHRLCPVGFRPPSSISSLAQLESKAQSERWSVQNNERMRSAGDRLPWWGGGLEQEHDYRSVLIETI
jgi:hypothetical protein